MTLDPPKILGQGALIIKGFNYKATYYAKLVLLLSILRICSIVFEILFLRILYPIFFMGALMGAGGVSSFDFVV